MMQTALYNAVFCIMKWTFPDDDDNDDDGPLPKHVAV